MLKPGLILFCIALITGTIGFFIGGGAFMLLGYLTPFLLYIVNHIKLFSCELWHHLLLCRIHIRQG